MQTRNTASSLKSPRAQRQAKNAVAAGEPAFPSRWWVHVLIVLALLGVCVGLYGRTCGLGFLTLDDPDYIQNNPFIIKLNGAKLWHILSTPYFANYAPGHLLSYALDIAVAGGKSARAMHLANLAWYAWVVCMVYVLGLAIFQNEDVLAQNGRSKVSRNDQPKGKWRISLFEQRKVLGTASGLSLKNATAARRGFLRVSMAAAAALLFAAHPAHVEVVAWLSSRKDLVATGFAALAMACYVHSRRAGAGAKWWYVGSILSFLLASSGKQSVLLLPLVMLAWDALVDQRRGWRLLLNKVPFGVIALFFGYMTWGAQPNTRQSADPFVLAMTQWSNLWLLTGLGQYVLYRPRPNPAEVGAFLKVLIIVGAVFVWVVPLLLARFRQLIRSTLCCWVLLQLLPPMALSFLTPLTDRYLFLPSVGVCLLLAPLTWNNPIQTRGGSQILGWGVLVTILGLWSWKTLDYVNQWRDPRSVWYFAAAKSPSPQAFEYSGEVYHEAADRVSEFIRSGKVLSVSNDLLLAGAVLNNSVQLEAIRAEWSGANSTRSNSLAYRERLWSLAWDQYQEAVAHRGTLNNPTLFMRRGMILINRSQYEDAIKEFKTGLELAQTHTYEKVRLELGTGLQRAIGVAYWGMGKYSDARDWLLKAQATQNQSRQTWIPTLDQEVERITMLARQQR